MPSPDKDRPSGRLGRLLAALPVQTGFPTSLADLVVKNHGRLRKQPSPSSKRRKGASPSPSPSPSPPPPRPPPAAAAVSLLSDRPRPDLSPAQGVRREESGAVGLVLGFLAVSGVASLALLVIWSKKVVAAVTVASFSLFLLESLRGSSRQRPAAGATERQHLYLDGRGRVSPIREAEAETELSRSDSDRGIEEVSSILSAEEKSDESSTSKGKPKRRAWKKLVASAKKLHRRGRKSKEAEDWSGSSLRGGEGDSADATERGSVEETTDVVAGYLGSGRGRSSEILVGPTEVDAPADLILTTEVAAAEEQGVEAVGSRFLALVLMAVVLVGLVAGKLPALALTVLCAAFFGSVPVGRSL
jgi:hypothetical protein